MQQWAALKRKEEANNCLQLKAETARWTEKLSLPEKVRSKWKALRRKKQRLKQFNGRKMQPVRKNDLRKIFSVHTQTRQSLKRYCNSVELLRKESNGTGPGKQNLYRKGKNKKLYQQWNSRKTSRGQGQNWNSLQRQYKQSDSPEKESAYFSGKPPRISHKGQEAGIHSWKTAERPAKLSNRRVIRKNNNPERNFFGRKWKDEPEGKQRG